MGSGEWAVSWAASKLQSAVTVQLTVLEWEVMAMMADSNLTSKMVTLNTTFNYTSPSIAQDVTVHSPGQPVEENALYKAIAQFIFFLSLSSLVGGVMGLFICLNIIQECKVVGLILFVLPEGDTI